MKGRGEAGRGAEKNVKLNKINKKGVSHHLDYRMWVLEIKLGSYAWKASASPPELFPLDQKLFCITLCIWVTNCQVAIHRERREGKS